MVAKYKRLLIQRETNVATGETWSIFAVPNTWRARTKAAVEADGYTWDEDGTAIKIPTEE